MEKLPTPPTLAEHIFTGELVPAVMGGKWVAEAEELKIGYDGKAIAELSLRIRRGQKIGNFSMRSINFFLERAKAAFFGLCLKRSIS